MAHKCGKCGVVVYRRIYSREQGLDLGVECGCTSRPRVLADSVDSKFRIAFDHVNDAAGGKLVVNSIRELERAEKTYGFQSVVLNSDAQNFDDPPQQPKIDMARVHNWRHSNESRYRENYERRR